MSIYSKAKENEVFGRYWPYIDQKDLFSLLLGKRIPLTYLPTYLLVIRQSTKQFTVDKKC